MIQGLTIWWSILAIILIGAYIAYRYNMKNESAANKTFDRQMWKGLYCFLPPAWFFCSLILISYFEEAPPLLFLWSWGISVTTFWAYTSMIVFRFGVQKSLSDSFYRLGGWKGQGWMFYAMCMIVVFTLAFPAFEYTKSETQVHVWLSLVGLLLVGIAADFKDKEVKLKHYAGAGVCFLCSQLWNFIETPYVIIPFVTLTAGLLIAKKDKNWVWWVEMAAFVSFFAALGLTMN